MPAVMTVTEVQELTALISRLSNARTTDLLHQNDAADEVLTEIAAPSIEAVLAELRRLDLPIRRRRRHH